MDRDNLFYLQRSKQIFASKSLLKTALKLYAVFGLLSFLISAGALAYTFLPPLDSTQQLLLSFSAVSIFVSLFSVMIVFYWDQRSERYERFGDLERLEEFLDTWSRFEEVSRMALENENGQFNRYSPLSIIRRLYEDGKISAEDVHTLEQALENRNGIVHGKGPKNYHLIERITNSMLDIIGKIA